MRDPAWLLARAEETWERHRDVLGPLAGKLAGGGFGGGAEWMRVALGLMRGGVPPEGKAGFATLGLLKYGFASLAGLAVLLPTLLLGPFWLWLAVPAGILAFYAVEVQGVFLFPAALAGSPHPWKTSRELLVSGGGTVVGVLTVLPLALRMLAGGFLGGGFVRSWCLGCLAVLHWYEAARGQGWTADESAVPKLSLGGRGPILIRTERHRLAGACGRIAFVSDLHWTGRTSGRDAEAIGAALLAVRPDAVVLGGDLADTRAGLGPVRSLVVSLTKHFPVLALPGNHDMRLGADLFRETLEAAGAVWLETWNPPRPLGWTLAGPSSPAEGATIRCRHDPARWKNDSTEITLAGHLHGGQGELWRSGGRHFPAAWFYRWCGLRFLREGRALFVSRGLGDTFPVRWKTPREILVLDLGDGRCS